MGQILLSCTVQMSSAKATVGITVVNSALCFLSSDVSFSLGSNPVPRAAAPSSGTLPCLGAAACISGDGGGEAQPHPHPQPMHLLFAIHREVLHLGLPCAGCPSCELTRACCLCCSTRLRWLHCFISWVHLFPGKLFLRYRKHLSSGF